MCANACLAPLSQISQSVSLVRPSEGRLIISALGDFSISHTDDRTNDDQPPANRLKYRPTERRVRFAVRGGGAQREDGGSARGTRDVVLPSPRPRRTGTTPRAPRIQASSLLKRARGVRRSAARSRPWPQRHTGSAAGVQLQGSAHRAPCRLSAAAEKIVN